MMSDTKSCSKKLLSEEDLSNYWNVLEQVDVVSIVYSSPRPGTDFLHSLLDDHSQIITFDGFLMFHLFYNNSMSVFGTEKFLVGFSSGLSAKKRKNIIIKDFFYEFAWANLHKFDSRYDTLEKKDQLGVSKNDFNYVSIDCFVNFAVQLMEQKVFSSRNAFLVVYAAYELSRGKELIGNKVLLHHAHDQEYISAVAKDFPRLKVIACMRDPRVYATTINKYIKKIHISKLAINSASAIFSIMIQGTYLLSDLRNIEVKVNVIERLHEEPELVMKSICEWLGIEYQLTVLRSTWNGKTWNGDSLSTGIDQVFSSSRYLQSKREWDHDLSIIDKVVIDSLMKNELDHYGYSSYKTKLIYIIIPLLILIPTKYEIRILSKIYKTRDFKLIYDMLKLIVKRWCLSYRKFFNNTFLDPKLFQYF